MYFKSHIAKNHEENILRFVGIPNKKNHSQFPKTLSKYLGMQISKIIYVTLENVGAIKEILQFILHNTVLNVVFNRNFSELALAAKYILV